MKEFLHKWSLEKRTTQDRQKNIFSVGVATTEKQCVSEVNINFQVTHFTLTVTHHTANVRTEI